MDEVRFKQIAVTEDGLLYGLALDGSVWVGKAKKIQT